MASERLIILLQDWPPLDSIPVVITPGVHSIVLWPSHQLNPFGRPTITGSVQAFGAWMAHNLAAAYHPFASKDPTDAK